MSNIPNSAVSAAMIPANRVSNELILARKVQSQKDMHHQEEVEELDDTGVGTVSDEQEAQEKRDRKRRKRPQGEKVEIESLKDIQVKAETEGEGHLDISA